MGLFSGFATRTGAGEAVFDQANYASNALALDSLTKQQHNNLAVIAGFIAVPEPSYALLLGRLDLHYCVVVDNLFVFRGVYRSSSLRVGFFVPGNTRRFLSRKNYFRIPSLFS